MTKKILTTWNWKAEPDAPRAWPDPVRRVVLVEPDPWEAGSVSETAAAFASIALAADRGSMMVKPTTHIDKMAGGPPLLDGIVPALLVRTQAELDAGEEQLLAVRSERRALLLEPIQALDLGLLLEVARSSAGGFFSLDNDDSRPPGAGQRRISWVIVRGSEAPLHPAWVRAIRDQCAAAGVPFCFLGWGEWVPICDALPVHERMATAEAHLWADGQWTTIGAQPREDLRVRAANCGLPELAFRVGAERSGRTLDDVEHVASPWGDLEVAS